MKIIGITGGVGSGKSRVLSYLAEEYGAFVCQADHVAWELQMPGASCYEQILSVFGRGILQDDGTINRKKLGQIVFADKERLQELNAIMHPAVKEKISLIINEQKQTDTNLFVLEAALLLEEHYDAICDEVWYIYTSEPVRRERLKSSRQYTDERINAIISTQKDEMFFREVCDKIIDNSSAFEETCRQIKEIMK